MYKIVLREKHSLNFDSCLWRKLKDLWEYKTNTSPWSPWNAVTAGVNYSASKHILATLIIITWKEEMDC